MDRCAAFAEAPDKVKRLIRGNTAGDDEKDFGTGERCGGNRRWRDHRLRQM
jgi:hypothetical protein